MLRPDDDASLPGLSRAGSFEFGPGRYVPVPGVEVLVSDQTGAGEAGCTTDVAGACRLPPRAAGRYRLSARAAGYTEAIERVELAQAGERRVVRLILRPSVRVSMRVRGFGEERPLRGVEVRLLTAEGQETVQTTGPSGAIERALAGGTLVRAHFYHRDYAGSQESFTVATDASTQNLEWVLPRGKVVLEGKVTDKSGLPIYGAALSEVRGDGECLLTARTDRGGNFAFRTVREEGLEVRVDKPGYRSFFMYYGDSEAGSRWVVDDRTFDDAGKAQIELAVAKELSGVVRADGAPLSRTSVRADCGHGEWHRATSNEDGQFSMRSLPRSGCTLHFRHPDHAPYTVAGASVRENMTFDLPPPARLDLKVLAPDGKTPITGLRYLVLGACGSTMCQREGEMFSRSGHFSIGRLPAETYKLTVDSKHGGALVEGVSLGVGEARRIPITMAASRVGG